MILCQIYFPNKQKKAVGITPLQVFQKESFYGPLRGHVNETWKAYKGQYVTNMKEISFKEYEPQKAKRWVFMSLLKCFQLKERKLPVDDMCIFQV